MAILTNDEILTHLQLTGVITSLQQAVLTQLRPACERLVKEFVGYEIEQASHTEYLPTFNRSIEGDQLVEGYEGSPAGAIPAYWGSSDGRIMYLTQLPVRSVTSLYENLSAWSTAGGSWPAANLLSEGPDFWIDYDSSLSGGDVCWSGALIRQYGVWPRERRTVKITYVAGLSADELDFDGRYGIFKQAALLTAQVNFMEALSNTLNESTGGPGTGVVGESLDGWSVQYLTSAVENLYSMKAILPDKVREMMQPYVSVSRFVGL